MEKIHCIENVAIDIYYSIDANTYILEITQKPFVEYIKINQQAAFNLKSKEDIKILYNKNTDLFR